jgi:hypothetical protein
MEIQVSVGEWMNTLQGLMLHAADGDCFCLPTFMLLKEGQFAERDFKVKVAQASNDDK